MPQQIDRRDVLKATGVAAMAGLAGCNSNEGDGGSGGSNGSDGGGSGSEGGGGDGGSQELGERVPTLVHQYLTSYSYWNTVMPQVQNAFEELGLSVELLPVDVPTLFENAFDDTRAHHLSALRGTANHTSVNPVNGPYGWQRIDWAGPNGDPNISNYADCEWTSTVFEAQSVADPDEQRSRVQDATEIASEDRLAVPVTSLLWYSAVRTDMVDLAEEDVNEPGWGMRNFNIEALANTTPTNGDQVVFGTDYSVADSKVHLNARASSFIGNRLYGSPLIIHNHEKELVPWIADDWQVSDDGTRITFDLNPDAQFHNGDPITAEHVKFTFETIEQKEVVDANSYDYEAINAVDDQTVEFVFAEPSGSFLTGHAAIWAILHKPTWEDMDSVSEFDFDLPLIGSGPFQFAGFRQGQETVLDPSPVEHPRLGEIDHQLIFRGFDDTSTQVRALQEGQLQITENIVRSDAQRLEDNLSDSRVEIVVDDTDVSWYFPVNYPRMPVNDNDFVEALIMSLPHNQLNQLANGGNATPVMNTQRFPPSNPYCASEDRLVTPKDEPTAQTEAARQKLIDAGWGYDDNGNLHYPPDMDTSPLWPEGESPSADDFPCINDEGKYSG